MKREELVTTLARLHQELAQTDKLDEQSIRSLQMLAKDIQSVLERSAQTVASGDVHPAETTLSGRIRGMIEDFEVQHPQLSQTLSIIAERLSDMGI